jgi:hypothetical protein
MKAVVTLFARTMSSKHLETQIVNLQEIEHLKNVLLTQVQQEIRDTLRGNDLVKKLEVASSLMTFINNSSVTEMTKTVTNSIRPQPTKMLTNSKHRYSDSESSDNDSSSDSDSSNSGSFRRLSCERHYTGKKKCSPEECYEHRDNWCRKHFKSNVTCTRECRDNKLTRKREHERRKLVRNARSDNEVYSS